MGGTSMGGITTFGCLAVYDWVDSAAVMMGAPGFVQLQKRKCPNSNVEVLNCRLLMRRGKAAQYVREFDLTKRTAALDNSPIYFWHGKQDAVVPYQPTFNFYEAVKRDYAAVSERIQFVTDNTAGHAVSRQGMLQSADWFACHLNE